MSTYNSNSNGDDTIPCGEILQLFRPHFEKDFDFDDVKEKVCDCFSKEEFEYIVNEKGNVQIQHMLWVLANKPQATVMKFLNEIASDYIWIVSAVKRELSSYSGETSLYMEKLRAIQSKHPKHTDFNVHRTAPYIQLRQYLTGLNALGKNGVVLLGELGSGKKWLAIDVCSDFAVMKCMGFKIFWVDCSDCTDPNKDYNALKRLMAQLKPMDNFSDEDVAAPVADKIFSLKAHIESLLNTKEFKGCLIVLADVQNVKAQEVFNLGCKRLIITRSPKVSNSLSRKVNEHMLLDRGLSICEFHLMLDKYIKTYYWRKYDSLYIYHSSNGDPYMLAIIAKHLQVKKSNWKEWKINLDTLRISDKKFRRYIANSLKILSENQMKLYATLSIFPHCAKIPVELLAFLWKKDLRETEQIIHKFHSYSLVKEEMLEDNDTMVCSLKFVFSSYIKNNSDMQKMFNPLELHQAVIQYYGVESLLDAREEVDLFHKPQHDSYFFRFIGHHIYRAGYTQLFPKLYMDFGFLGQKMRNVGLAFAIADLKHYEREILCGNPKHLLIDIESFLANVEEKLSNSQDCNLLQYALLATEDSIRNLAQQQIMQFPQRLWFQETGQFHQRRMIASLPGSCRLVRILDNDICMAVLSNNDIYLVDISLKGNLGPVHLIKGTSANIEEVIIFNNNDHLLKLDQWGRLELWNIADEVRRIISQRRDNNDSFNRINYKLCPQQSCTPKLKQCVSNRIHADRRIVAMHVVNVGSYLHVALDNGDIIMFEWMPQDEEFRNYYMPCNTNILNIQCICVVKCHWMILDANQNSMNITFINRRNTGKENIQFQWPGDKLSHFVSCEVRDYYILLAFRNAIILLKPNFDTGIVGGQCDVLFRTKTFHITCAKLSVKDNLLAMGTERGLHVLDVNKGDFAILPTIVSENVKCLDIYDLDDKCYQQMVVCGVENKGIVYLLALLKTRDNALVWHHNRDRISLENSASDERRNIRLIGQRLFDYSGDTTLFAVDIENRVLQISTSDLNNWHALQLPVDNTTEITAICCKKDKAFVAMADGRIYDADKKTLEHKCSLSTPIVYLKFIRDDILVASSNSGNGGFTTVIVLGGKSFTEKFVTKFCAAVMDDYVLFVTDCGATVFLDISKEDISYSIPVEAYEFLADCDFKNNTLFLGFSKYAVHIYTLKDMGKIDCQKRCEVGRCGTNYIITCLCASSNGKLFAIGLNTTEPLRVNNNSLMGTSAVNNSIDNLRSCGDIEVYKLDELFKEQLIYVLKSHTTPICDMRFSPHNDVLVSLSEQICFWSVPYILNNPSDANRKQRLSSRFSSQKSKEEVDATVVYYEPEQSKTMRFIEIDAKLSPSFASCVNNKNMWQSLKGPESKPELLSCLKLDGNVAKQIFSNSTFTQFLTIDDEGVYYNLNVIPPPSIAVCVKEDSPDSVGMADIQNIPALLKQNLFIASSASGTDVVDVAGPT